MPHLTPAAAIAERPPRPRLTFRIGVTGHRWGASLDPAAMPRVTAQLRGVLRHAADLAQSIHAAHAGTFDAASPSLVAMSALAEGGDRLLATQALAAGWSLEAVLPFAADDYETDFASPASKQEYRALLGTASSVFEIADPRSHQEASEAYETAGLVMLDNTDLLVAIWDGGASRGRGGTREILDEAVRRGTPVIWIHATEACAAALWDGTTAFPLPDIEVPGGQAPPQLAQVMNAALAPPAGGDRADSEAAGRLAAFLHGEPWSAPWWVGGYDVMLWLATGRPLRLFDKGPSVADRSGEWNDYLGALPPNGGLASRMRDVLLARFLWADHVAGQYGKAYRGAYVLNFVLAALAVAVGLLAVFFWDSVLAKTLFVTVEFVLITLILAITHVGSRQSWHQRFLDARRLAELLRHGRVLAPVARAGGSADVARPDAGERWTAWYARASLRELGIPRAQADQPYLQSVAEATLAHEVEPQIRYHHVNHHRLHHLHHALDHVGERAFYLTALLCLVWIASAGLYAVTGAGWVKSVLKPTLTFFGAVLPAVGAALAGIRAQGDYEASARRSQTTERELTEIVERVKLAPPADYRQACLLQLWIADAMASDLGSWRSLYVNRPLTIPG